MRFALGAALIAAAALCGPASATDSAGELVQARYSPQDLEPLLSEQARALIRAQTVPAGVTPDQLVKALKARLPEFYETAGKAVATLVAPASVEAALAFSKSATGQKVLKAERRWRDEVKDQAELCLEEGAGRIGAAKADRSTAVKAAAGLVLGGCPAMTAATEEQIASFAPGRIDQARAYVQAGGMRPESVRLALASASAPAAKALVFHGVYSVTEQAAAREAVVAAAVSQQDLWTRAAAVHFASAFRAPDFDAVAAFAKSEEGKAFLAAKGQIDGKVRQVLKAWVVETAPLILASAEGQGGPEMVAESDGAASLGMSVAAGVEPIAPAKVQAVNVRVHPKLLLKPVASKP